MLAEIIRELTKAKKHTAVTSKQVLVWAKRVESHRAKSVIITSLSKTKEFDKIKTINGGQRYNLKNQTCTKMPAKQSLSYCGFSHPTRQCPAWEEAC